MIAKLYELLSDTLFSTWREISLYLSLFFSHFFFEELMS